MAKYNPSDYEPIQPTRQNEQMIAVLSMVSSHKSTQEIIDILNMNINSFRTIYDKMPSLPKPYDYEKYE